MSKVNGTMPGQGERGHFLPGPAQPGDPRLRPRKDRMYPEQISQCRDCFREWKWRASPTALETVAYWVRCADCAASLWERQGQHRAQLN